MVRNNIPFDLEVSILSNLPLKSLKRFACVCKAWGLVFENPNFLSIFSNNFISHQHSYYDDTPLLLLQMITDLDTGGLDTRYNSLYSLCGESFINKIKLEWPNPFYEEDLFYYILEYCSIDGTLCLCNHRDSLFRIVLWNPTTKKLNVIPRSPNEFVPCEWSFIKIQGFGYDYIRDDYKIIRELYLVPPRNDSHDDEDIYRKRMWEIYSLRSNSWRTLHIDMPFSYSGSAYFPPGERIYIYKTCHWLGSSDTNPNGPCLVSFNLSDEIFITTLIPFFKDAKLPDNYFSIHLVLLNGSIATVSWYHGSPTFHISVLGKLGVTESWIKLFIIGPLLGVDHPIGVGKEGNIFFRKQDGELILFDLRTQMIRELAINGWHFSQVVTYKESFIPIGGINL
ncbi:putative F-box protein At3g24700 [Vicia villosa]|uniref:putative F-box protein At3g24700 n=1 Tax=Vicia villosa TaxID=3911 RepID=UPI00273C3AC0|nr:putative F-box protein At3g24700 [Vicia villosa]